MISDKDLWFEVNALLSREALLLDSRQWDEWLSLYETGAEYWMPAWLDNGEPTSDPNTQISLVYCDKSGLEDRVFRVKEGKSAASLPFPRTCHFFSLLSATREGELIRASTNWTVNSYREGQTMNYYGTADYTLRGDDPNLKIMKKKMVLLNDVTEAVLDFYSV